MLRKETKGAESNSDPKMLGKQGHGGRGFGGIKKVKRTFGEGLENVGIPLIH